MKRLGGYALTLLLLFSLTLNGYYFFSQQKTMTVVDVHDGDTFTLGDGQRVRLLGADAPELGRCGADEAKQILSKLVLEKRIRITEEKRDTYGRRMGLVYIGSQLVNEALLRSGYARPDYTANSQNERLKAAYREATEAKRGIHSAICKQTSPTPPSPACTIKGNIDKGTWDHLYHLPSCRHYNQIVLDTDMGEQFFCSEKEAKAAGFSLAPDCLR
jgi:endonuclease YncB( thermonuclease family)